MARTTWVWVAAALMLSGCDKLRESSVVNLASTAISNRDFKTAIDAILKLNDNTIAESDTLTRLLSTAYYGMTMHPRTGIGAECVDIDYTLDGKTVVFTDAQLGALTVYTYPEMEYVTTVSLSTAAYASDISPDGRHIATALDDGSFAITDIASWQPQDVYGRHRARVRGIAYADSSRIVTCSNDKTVALWNINGVTKFCDRRQLHGMNIKSIKMSPDHTRLITASNDGAADIISLCGDSISRNEIRLIHGREYVNDAALSPDGKTAVTVSGDGTLKIWNTADGSHKLTIDLGQPLCSVDISPDGTLIATSGIYNVAVIEAKSNRIIADIPLNSIPAWALKFVNDSTLSFADNTRFACIRLYTPKKLVKAARQLQQ